MHTQTPHLNYRNPTSLESPPNESNRLFSGQSSTATEFASNHFALSLQELGLELHAQHAQSGFSWRGVCSNPMQQFCNMREKLRTKFGHNLTVSLAALADAAASTLSYSAGLIANSSKVHRSMASSGAWATSAIFGAIEHTTFIHKPMPVAVLSDFASLGGAVSGMTSTGLSARGKYGQTILNANAFISNALLLTSGLLSTLSVARGEYDTPDDQTTLPTISRTGKRLTAIAGLVNVLSAVAGIVSTATSDGNNVRLNQTSSSLWMAASLLSAIGALLRAQMAMDPFVKNNVQLELDAANARYASTTHELESKIHHLTSQIESHLGVIEHQTQIINDQQNVMSVQASALKMHERISGIQDAAIEKLKQRSFRRRSAQPTVALSDGE